jgi:hypothetical protein
VKRRRANKSVRGAAARACPRLFKSARPDQFIHFSFKQLKTLVRKIVCYGRPIQIVIISMACKHSHRPTWALFAVLCRLYANLFLDILA